MKSYQDFKNEIDLVEFAVHHGYQLVRKDGLKWPSLVHPATQDAIIINPSHRLYREKYNTDAGGDILRFIKDRANDVFAKYNTSSHPQEFHTLINNVCYEYLQISPAERRAIKDYIPSDLKARKAGEASFFSLEALAVRPLDDPYYLIKQRSLDPMVLKDPIFKPKLVNKEVRLESGRVLTNTGFIYCTSIIEEKAVGLELRNNNFKSHEEGSDRYHGLGFSALTGQPVSRLVIGESFIDQMSYHQLHGSPQHAYASTGGQLTQEQIEALVSARQQLASIGQLAKDFKFVLSFDNDLNGHSYDLQFIRRLGGGQEQLPITKVYARQNISHTLAYRLLLTEKINAISADLVDRLEKLNKIIESQHTQTDKFTIVRNPDGHGALQVEFPKDSRYLALFNQSLTQSLKLDQVLQVHKATCKDFNDDLKLNAGKAVAQQSSTNNTITVDFTKLSHVNKL